MINMSKIKEKIGIITINDFANYGNRLQNYALQEVIKKIGYECYTIRNIPPLNEKKKFFLRYIKHILIKKTHKNMGVEVFRKFNENILFTDCYINPFNSKKFKFKKIVVGSDQVWNPRFGRLRSIDLLDFITNEEKISYAASFGISDLTKEEKLIVKNNFSVESFKNISVREESAKKIIEDITNRNDIKVVLDPTLLLSSEEWKKVEMKPSNVPSKKYILTYFLGENILEKYLEKLSKENNYEIINIRVIKDDESNKVGPSEFLYLFRNAEVIFTDSFHACVFSIIYKRRFYVTNRVEKNVESMSSRIDTLLESFSLEDRRIEKIKDVKLNLDDSINYTKVYSILEKKKKESIECLKKFIGN